MEAGRLRPAPLNPLPGLPFLGSSKREARSPSLLDQCLALSVSQSASP